MHAAILTATLLLGAAPQAIAGEGGSNELVAASPAVAPYSPSIVLVYPSPQYDCFDCLGDGITCYPNFRERYYRRPYNYRVQFDYPWHEDVYRNWPDACVCDEGEVIEATSAMNATANYRGQHKSLEALRDDAKARTALRPKATRPSSAATPRSTPRR